MFLAGVCALNPSVIHVQKKIDRTTICRPGALSLIGIFLSYQKKNKSLWFHRNISCWRLYPWSVSRWLADFCEIWFVWIFWLISVKFDLCEFKKNSWWFHRNISCWRLYHWSVSRWFLALWDPMETVAILIGPAMIRCVYAGGVCVCVCVCVFVCLCVCLCVCVCVDF